MSENEKNLEEFLQDGKVLTILINEHNAIRSEKSFTVLLSCLADDPPVWVPMTVTASDEDIENILKSGVGSVVKTKNEIRMKPDILKNGEGELFFPGFSMQEEAPETYRNHFSWVKMPMSNCVNVALQMKNLKGMVLNGFSSSFVLPNSLLQLLKDIYSNRKE